MFLFFLPYSTALNTDEKCKTYFTYLLGLDKKTDYIQDYLQEII